MARRTRNSKRTASGRYGHWIRKRQKTRALRKKLERKRTKMHKKAHRSWMPLDVHSPKTRKKIEEDDFKKIARRTMSSIERNRK